MVDTTAMNREDSPGAPAIRAVLFDLDGTLLDTATDLAMPVNDMRIERGLSPLALDELRPHASAGARGLLGAGFGLKPGDAQFDAMRTEFLARYERNIVVHTRLFNGMAQVLATLQERSIPWGIVSNKFERYVRMVCDRVTLSDGRKISEVSRTLIGGDTAGRPKPAPDPLLLACRQMSIDPATALYVGDDQRDIEAARAAGMPSVAAAYGYGVHTGVAGWQADFIVQTPQDLIALLK